MTYTKNTLQKIEDLFKELGYTVRYEKGSFQSGYCLVEGKQMAIVNKFFETDARINALVDILDKIAPSTPNTEGVSEKSLKVLKDIQKLRETKEIK